MWKNLTNKQTFEERLRERKRGPCKPLEKKMPQRVNCQVQSPEVVPGVLQPSREAPWVESSKSVKVEQKRSKK